MNNFKNGEAPFNWPALSMFIVTTLGALIAIPWYLINREQHISSWIFMLLIMGFTGTSITAGYHRLWSHRSYEANKTVQIFFMLFGSMAFQNSILIWSSLHRTHHKHVDDEENDPYSIKRGFIFAHLGWMIRNYPSSKNNFKNAPDLTKNKIVMFQHKYYLLIALTMNIVFPLIVGYFFGDPIGFLLLGGLLRLVMNHHFTFFINSLAHMWGRRPYTRLNSARDNDFLSLFTFGEGYHNYHHCFQWDYRNGIRWWHFDPTKWMIKTLSLINFTYNLKKVPNFKIRKALLEESLKQFEEKLNKKMASHNDNGILQELHEKYKNEVEIFLKTVESWSMLQSDKIKAAQKNIADKWDNSLLKHKLQAIEYSLYLQRQRIKMLHIQAHMHL